MQSVNVCQLGQVNFFASFAFQLCQLIIKIMVELYCEDHINYAQRRTTTLAHGLSSIRRQDNRHRSELLFPWYNSYLENDFHFMPWRFTLHPFLPSLYSFLFLFLSFSSFLPPSSPSFLPFLFLFIFFWYIFLCSVMLKFIFSNSFSRKAKHKDPYDNFWVILRGLQL